MESHRSCLENHHHPYKHLLLSSLQPFIVSIHSAILLFSHQCLSHSLPHSFSFSFSYSSFLLFFPFSFPFLHLPHSPFFFSHQISCQQFSLLGGKKTREERQRGGRTEFDHSPFLVGASSKRVSTSTEKANALPRLQLENRQRAGHSSVF